MKKIVIPPQFAHQKRRLSVWVISPSSLILHILTTIATAWTSWKGPTTLTSPCTSSSPIISCTPYQNLWNPDIVVVGVYFLPLSQIPFYFVKFSIAISINKVVYIYFHLKTYRNLNLQTEFDFGQILVYL